MAARAPSTEPSRKQRVSILSLKASYAWLPRSCAPSLNSSWNPRIAGVDSYDVSLEKQEVIVRGSAEYDYVLEKIKKTGKEVRRYKLSFARMPLFSHIECADQGSP